jgi:hypothetical protein
MKISAEPLASRLDHHTKSHTAKAVWSVATNPHSQKNGEATHAPSRLPQGWIITPNAIV